VYKYASAHADYLDGIHLFKRSLIATRSRSHALEVVPAAMCSAF
jgi:hypothetical protein